MQPTRKKSCSTAGCGNVAAARGMCTRCYGKSYRAGEIQPRLKLGIHALSDVDTEARTATCAICGPVKIRVRFDGRGHECMTVRRRNRGKGGATTPLDRWRLVYGLSPDDYARMWLRQDGACAICQAFTDLVVDHCHTSGAVRGLLCHRCNVALGWMDDDVLRLRRAADYLEH